jgi:DNA replication protein DnaC
MGMRVVVRPDGSRVAEECDCVRTRIYQHEFKNLRIPAKYADATLETFDAKVAGPGSSIQAAHLAASGYAANYPAMISPGRGILFSGPPGLGKTHLSVGILKALHQAGHRKGLFCYYQQLLKDIQNSWNPQTSTTELQVLEPIFDAEVLVLDDLGSVKPTDWVWDMVSMILNTRYNQKSVTIVTTNFENRPSGALGAPMTLGDRIGDRMRSRLLEMCREVKMQGQDYREKFVDQEAGLNKAASGC